MPISIWKYMNTIPKWEESLFRLTFLVGGELTRLVCFMETPMGVKV